MLQKNNLSDTYVLSELLSELFCAPLTEECTVRSMSRMRLISLQKCNRAQKQRLFHPAAVTSECCNPLSFGQMCVSCAYCALTG